MNDEYEKLSLFLASSIHEIKNAFFRLQALNDDLMQHIPADESIKSSRSKIQLESQNISGQLNQLLVAYKNNEAGYMAKPDEIFMEDYLAEIHGRHQATLSLLNVAFNAHSETDLVAVIDEPLVSNALDTLIYNATQAQASEIKITAYTKDPYAVIQVEDNGPGFPKSCLETAANTKPQPTSAIKSGLGLGFTQRITRMHRINGFNGHTVLGKSPLLNGAMVQLYFPG